MADRTFAIHRAGIDRFSAIVDGEEIVAVRASDYDAMETARDIVCLALDEAEAQLRHIKKFLDPTGWQKAQDEHNALRERLTKAERDAERLTWLERWIADNSGGLELYPIGPTYEYGPDGNEIIRVESWTLADEVWPVETLRQAIDAAMATTLRESVDTAPR